MVHHPYFSSLVILKLSMQTSMSSNSQRSQLAEIQACMCHHAELFVVDLDTSLPLNQSQMWITFLLPYLRKWTQRWTFQNQPFTMFCFRWVKETDLSAFPILGFLWLLFIFWLFPHHIISCLYYLKISYMDTLIIYNPHSL